MCQGCRSLSDGSIPIPPFDLVMDRSEWRTFRDKSGVLITPLQEKTSHYHLRLDCVQAVKPNFVPLALITTVHQEYLRLVSGQCSIISPFLFDLLSDLSLLFERMC